MYCYRKKRFFEKKFSKWPVTPTFFSVSLFSSTCSCGRVKKIEVFMFKIPDFSLAPGLCKQAGLDLVPAWKDLDPRTLVSRDPTPFLHDCALRWALRRSHLKSTGLHVYRNLKTASFVHYKECRLLIWNRSISEGKRSEALFILNGVRSPSKS